MVADIPGLIEGASEGAGLGDRFLRHIERTRVIVHLLDAGAALLEVRDLLAGYDAIRGELEAYQPGLLDRTEIVALNKVDLVAERERARRGRERAAAPREPGGAHVGRHRRGDRRRCCARSPTRWRRPTPRARADARDAAPRAPAPRPRAPGASSSRWGARSSPATASCVIASSARSRARSRRCRTPAAKWSWCPRARSRSAAAGSAGRTPGARSPRSRPPPRSDRSG